MYLCRSGSEFTRMTPSDAAPEMGLMTAGKPTCWAAAGRSLGLRMMKLCGVGRPASAMTSLVLYSITRSMDHVASCSMILILVHMHRPHANITRVVGRDRMAHWHMHADMVHARPALA